MPSIFPCKNVNRHGGSRRHPVHGDKALATCPERTEGGCPSPAEQTDASRKRGKPSSFAMPLVLLQTQALETAEPF